MPPAVSGIAADRAAEDIALDNLHLGLITVTVAVDRERARWQLRHVELERSCHGPAVDRAADRDFARAAIYLRFGVTHRPVSVTPVQFRRDCAGLNVVIGIRSDVHVGAGEFDVGFGSQGPRVASRICRQGDRWQFGHPFRHRYRHRRRTHLEVPAQFGAQPAQVARRRCFGFNGAGLQRQLVDVATNRGADG